MSTVVLNAGFDGEANYELARLDLGVESVIPPRIGRPARNGGARPPRSRWRRLIYEEFRDGGGVTYRRREAVACVNSMIKRNQGPDLWARTAKSRGRKMLLRAVVHNTTLFRRHGRGSRQSRSDSKPPPSAGVAISVDTSHWTSASNSPDAFAVSWKLRWTPSITARPTDAPQVAGTHLAWANP